jgi:hypothetical protein
MVYELFKKVKEPVTGVSFFNRKHAAIFKTGVSYVKKGYLSDKPGVTMYVPLRTLCTGLVVYRSRRQSSALEGYHLHLRLALSVLSRRAGSDLVEAVTNEFDFRFCVNALRKLGLFASAVYHYDIDLLDELAVIVRRLGDRLCHEVLPGHQMTVRGHKPMLKHGLHYPLQAHAASLKVTSSLLPVSSGMAGGATSPASCVNSAAAVMVMGQPTTAAASLPQTTRTTPPCQFAASEGERIAEHLGVRGRLRGWRSLTKVDLIALVAFADSIQSTTISKDSKGALLSHFAIHKLGLLLLPSRAENLVGDLSNVEMGYHSMKSLGLLEVQSQLRAPQPPPEGLGGLGDMAWMRKMRHPQAPDPVLAVNGGGCGDGAGSSTTGSNEVDGAIDNGGAGSSPAVSREVDAVGGSGVEGNGGSAVARASRSVASASKL